MYRRYVCHLCCRFLCHCLSTIDSTPHMLPPAPAPAPPRVVRAVHGHVLGCCQLALRVRVCGVCRCRRLCGGHLDRLHLGRGGGGAWAQGVGLLKRRSRAGLVGSWAQGVGGGAGLGWLVLGSGCRRRSRAGLVGFWAQGVGGGAGLGWLGPGLRGTGGKGLPPTPPPRRWATACC